MSIAHRIELQDYFPKRWGITLQSLRRDGQARLHASASWDRITVLLEEYRALYALLTFRLSAMDRRLPVAGGTLGVLLGGTTAMPPDTKLVFLLGLPAALMWMVRSTVGHARSKEDHLRRIDEIERLVNHLAGEELLVFQSRHPNKRKRPSGRSGAETVVAVLIACLTMLGACSYLIVQPVQLLPNHVWIYHGYASICASSMLVTVFRLRHYRYQRPPADHRPVFERHA